MIKSFMARSPLSEKFCRQAGRSSIAALQGRIAEVVELCWFVSDSRVASSALALANVSDAFTFKIAK